MGYAERLNQGKQVAVLQPKMDKGLVQVGRVLLGYPVGNSEMTCFSASVRRLVTYEHMKAPEDRVLAGTTVAPGLYVDDNRNAMVQRMLDIPEAKWLLMVDTDIEFKTDVLDRMVHLAESRGIKILAASVPIGETWSTSGYRFKDGVAGEWEGLEAHEIGPEPVEVDGIATACAMIHREAFEAIAAKHGQRWFYRVPVQTSPEGTPPAQTKYINEGEDFSFCLRAKDVGLSIWVAHVPGLRHWKLKGYTHDPPELWPQSPKRGG